MKNKTLKDALLETEIAPRPSAEESPLFGHPNGENFLADLQRQLFHQILPSYILDLNFQYLDWNPAFDEIIARPLGFRRGMHGTLLISKLANCNEVMERSLRQFTPGNHPLVDEEPLLLPTDRYGLVRFHKMAAQLLDHRGQCVGWALTLNVSGADNLPLLWSDIVNRVQYETAYHQYASARDRLLPSTVDGKNLFGSLLRAAQGANSAGRIIELGAGTGELTKLLLTQHSPKNIFAHEDNFGLLDVLAKRFPLSAARPTLVKESLEQLADYPARYFDVAVSWDNFWRNTSMEKIVAGLAHVVRPEGTLALALRLDGGTPATLIAEAANQIPPRQNPETRDLAQINLERSVKILDEKHPRPTANEFGRIVDAAGFHIEVFETNYFGGGFCLLVARKR